jgi:hypothetical protein
MYIGQKVYVQKVEIAFHKFYKARIVDIHRQKRPSSQGTPMWCIFDVLTCCKTLPIVYVVEYQDGERQTVTADRIEEHI